MTRIGIAGAAGRMGRALIALGQETEGLVVAAALLLVGTRVWDHAGMHWTLPSLVVAGLAQTAWLAWRARGVIRELR